MIELGHHCGLTGRRLPRALAVSFVVIKAANIKPRS
jgi:hypothetical protein